MPSVIFVALDHMRCLDWLVGWVGSRPGTAVSEVPSLQAAASEVPRLGPVLMIAPSSEVGALEELAHAVAEHQCQAGATVVFVHLATPEYGLLVQEWDCIRRSFSPRRCSLAHLQREIDAVLARYQVPPQVYEQIRGIGYYDCVKVDGQTLHVQTEVAGRSEPCVRTTVHRDGALIYTATAPWSAGSDRGRVAGPGTTRPGRLHGPQPSAELRAWRTSTSRTESFRGRSCTTGPGCAGRRPT